MSNDPRATLPRHMPALDGLRGVAILMVLMIHCWGGWWMALCLYGDTMGSAATFVLPWWLDAVASQGFHGVQLFFVVSAFTLTIQAGRRHDGWAAYAMRRIARVGPGYWLAGLLYTLAVGANIRYGAPSGISGSDFGIAALFGSAWQGGPSTAVVPGGWSVSCEMAFYVALPLLLAVINGRLWRIMLLTGAAMLGVQVLARYEMTHGGWTYMHQYINPVIQAPVFLAGIAAAVLAQRVRLPQAPGAALALLAAAVFGIPFLGLAVKEWFVLPHLPFAALAAGVVLLAAQHPPALLTSAPMRRLGEVSYSLYLIHFALLAPCLAAAEWLVPGDVWATLALYMGLTIAAGVPLAIATHCWVERPGIRLGARLLAKPMAPVPAE